MIFFVRPVVRKLQITPFSVWSLGAVQQYGTNDGPASAVWPATNLALYIPFRLPNPWQMAKAGWQNGATVTGNVDIGIYSASGLKLYSAGTTAQSGANVIQTVDPTDQYFDGGLYYIGFAGDSNTNVTIFRESGASARVMRAMGMAQEASAFPLPATATMALLGQSSVPCVFLTTVTTL